VKLELSSRPEEHHVANAAPYTEMSADKVPEIIPSNPWNSSTSTKLAAHKGGSISTADGKVVEFSCCVGMGLISVACKQVAYLI
jgi:hypothetical protein